MIQTIVIAVGISVTISAIFTFAMIAKSSKALSVEVTKYISRNQNNK